MVGGHWDHKSGVMEDAVHATNEEVQSDKLQRPWGLWRWKIVREYSVEE